MRCPYRDAARESEEEPDASAPAQFGGIATAVFRRASNGEAHLSRVNSELGLGLQIISQQLEGELGYLSAQAGLGAAGLPPGGLVAWDSGGGSFQMICHVDGQMRVRAPAARSIRPLHRFPRVVAARPALRAARRCLIDAPARYGRVHSATRMSPSSSSPRYNLANSPARGGIGRHRTR